MDFDIFNTILYHCHVGISSSLSSRCLRLSAESIPLHPFHVIVAAVDLRNAPEVAELATPLRVVLCLGISCRKALR